MENWIWPTTVSGPQLYLGHKVYPHLTPHGTQTYTVKLLRCFFLSVEVNQQAVDSVLLQPVYCWTGSHQVRTKCICCLLRLWGNLMQAYIWLKCKLQLWALSLCSNNLKWGQELPVVRLKTERACFPRECCSLHCAEWMNLALRRLQMVNFMNIFHLNVQ